MLLALSFALVLLFSPGLVAAQAASNCMPLDMMTERFKTQHNEHVVWLGVDRQGRQLVVLGQPGGGTFTLFAVRDGIACGMAHGIGWAAIQPIEAVPGEDG